MKKNLLVVISLLVVMSAAMAAPVMAATTGNSTITGNPGAAIDIAVTGSISNWALAVGSNTNSAAVDLVVSSNTATWTVAVKDVSDGSKPQSWAGRMVEWDGVSAYVASPAILGANMTVAGATVSGSSGSSATLSSADQAIETGSAAVSLQSMDITIGQAVAYTDLELPDPHVYRIIVTFTGSVT
jgi:opacity protein-like surface antigen